MEYLSLFRMPTRIKIVGRSSSITNAFISSIIPVVPPSAEEVKQALEILGMNTETFQCAYCGSVASEWDHLRPLVKDKKPTGYISEIHNLVPSCGKCNQSKGNKEWKTWMLSAAKLSPTARGIKDIAERIKRLKDYENFKTPTKMDFATIVGPDVWAQHQSNLERVQSLMRESQALATKINAKIANAYKTLQPSSREERVSASRQLPLISMPNLSRGFEKMQDRFIKYLIDQGYKKATASGKRSTAYDYSKRVDMVCQNEGISLVDLTKSISQIIKKYEVGGELEHVGNKSHRAVINALKIFNEFVESEGAT